MGIVAGVAQVLKQRVQLRKIIIQRRHLSTSGSVLLIGSARGFRDGLLDSLAVLIGRRLRWQR